VAALAPGISKYSVSISMGERKINMAVTSTIREVDGHWEVSDVMSTPGGDVVEMATLDKATLQLKKRVMKQGAAETTMEVAGGKAVGMVKANGQERPFEKELPGPLFADGAGGPNVLGTLPLAKGYKATFTNFDLARQRVKPMQLEVTAEESVVVPAGTFATWKVEVSAADGGNDNLTFWFDTKTRKNVKASAVLPQAGGATMVMELLP